METSKRLSALTVVMLTACSGTPEETHGELREELRNRGSRVVSTEYANPEALIPAGIAADDDVMFVGAPIEGRVLVLSRRTRAQIAELPAPPGNFVLPLILHTIGPNRVAVLDSGGFPSPGTADANPTLYEYDYDFAGGAFSATLARSVPFTGKRVGFAEEFAYLGSGRYLVTDAVYGSIWVVTQTGEVHPGIVPKTFEPAHAIPELAFCTTMPEITVGGLPFLFTGATIPGVGGIAVRERTVFFYSSCAGALYEVPLATLFDSRPAWRRAADIRLVSSKPRGVVVEELLETQFDPFDPSDPYLYAADALQLRLIRIDSRNGRREVLADDPRLFNFPSSLAFLPPPDRERGGRGERDGRKELLVLSNQQHRTPITNAALTEDFTEPPYIVTKVTLKDPPRHH